MLIQKAIEALGELVTIENETFLSEDRDNLDCLKTGDERKIEEVFRYYLDGFDVDLEGGWDCCCCEQEHFLHTALEIIARLYLDKPILYKKR